MPTTTTSGSSRSSQESYQSGRSSSSGVSRSTQGGFSQVLAQDPGALEQALNQLVMDFLDRAAGTEQVMAPNPNDAALVSSIQRETFGNASRLLGRRFSQSRDEVSSRLAALGVLDSSATADALGGLAEEEAAQLSSVASQGAATASNQLIGLTESARNRGLQQQAIFGNLASTASGASLGLAQMRINLGRRIFENTGLSTNSTTGSNYSSGYSSSVSDYIQRTQRPTDWTGILGAVGGAAGAYFGG